MKRAGPDFCWLGLGILVVLLVLAVSGPVMRERDQAALLEGSIEIARTQDIKDAGYYNYDKQFLSYWTLAAVFRMAGLEAPGWGVQAAPSSFAFMQRLGRPRR